MLLKLDPYELLMEFGYQRWLRVVDELKVHAARSEAIRIEQDGPEEARPRQDYGNED